MNRIVHACSETGFEPFYEARLSKSAFRLLVRCLSCLGFGPRSTGSILKLSGRFRPDGREVKNILFDSVSKLSALALMHSIRRNGVPSFSPHKIVTMSAAKRGSMHIMLKGIEAGVQRNGVPRSLDVDRTVHACSEMGFQPF